jgi:hypothetical protein
VFHLAPVSPTIDALFDTGAERSAISKNCYNKLKEKNEVNKFTREVDVDPFSINYKRLVTEGKINVNFVVADEAPHQLLEQEFIIVNGIVENCVLGRDALYQHYFVYNGRKQTIYRVPEIDHFQEKETPFVIARPFRIPFYSSCVL